MVVAGSIVVLLGAVAAAGGVIAAARRRVRSRPWPQLLVLVGVALLLVGLLVRSSGRHQDVCTYDSQRCAVPTGP